MFRLFKKKPQLEPSAAQIVPRIKHVNFLTTAKEIPGITADTLPLTEPFVADLLIAYSFDLPDMFMMFRNKDLKRLGLTIEQVRSKAIENLRKQLPPVKQSGEPPLVMLTVGNNLEACLLLIDELWNELSKSVLGKLVVAVPSRDVLLFTSSKYPDVLNEMCEISNEARKQEPVHGLSECLLAWENGRWVIFNGDPATKQ